MGRVSELFFRWRRANLSAGSLLFPIPFFLFIFSLAFLSPCDSLCFLSSSWRMWRVMVSAAGQSLWHEGWGTAAAGCSCYILFLLNKLDLRRRARAARGVPVQFKAQPRCACHGAGPDRLGWRLVRLACKPSRYLSVALNVLESRD